MKARGLWVAWLAVFTILCCGASFGDDRRDKGAGEGDPKNLWVYKQSAALGVAEAELVKLVDDCRARGFTTSEIQRMLGLVARAKLSGLPHKTLLFKLQEGLAKHASPELIDAALAGKAQNLKKAKGIVDNLIIDGFVAKDYDMAIGVVSDSLEAGLSQQAIVSIIREGGAPPEGLPDPASMFLSPEAKKR